MTEKEYTFPEILSKAEHYCALAEKCQFDVSKKLKEWGADYEKTDRIIVHLIEGNYINELRYAKAFTNDSYRLKKWGRVKIKQKLKSKQISEYSINKALQDIDEKIYLKNARSTFQKKWSESKGNQWERSSKVKRYLSNRGYEFEVIQNLIDDQLS